MSFHVPEHDRLATYSTAADGNNGIFIIRPAKSRFFFQCIASDGLGWEHVSVTLRFANSGNFSTPSWDEMCYIKSLFWDEEDVVMQLHPAKSEYVNMHENVLHLWRPIDKEIPTPPSITVGFK